MLTSTEIGKHINQTPRQVNQLLKEAGYIIQAKNNGGWLVTEIGTKNGGTLKKHPQTGNSYIVWNDNILKSSIFVTQNQPENSEPKNNSESEFRTKFPAQLRTTDGHYVRSRAELLIDNWLYMAEIVHAYERKLPIEEEAYCDFYLPTGKVYIEFWGLENNPAYLKRKQTKIEIYRKYNFSLVELNDTDIEKLDDVLPAKLLAFGIKTY